MLEGRAVRPRSDELMALAELVFSVSKRGRVNDETRAHLGAELARRGFASLRPYAGSLEQDPSAPADYYLAVDALEECGVQPLLLQLSSESTAPAARFRNPLQEDRLRLPSGREVDLELYSFASRDRDAIRTFAEEVAPIFLPRPQRALPAIAAGNRHPEISLPPPSRPSGRSLGSSA